VIHLLQECTRRGDYAQYKQYAEVVDFAGKPHTLRGLLEMQYASEPIPIDEVESVEEIVKRFKTGAMSFGSISREAHECMAIAMNTLGGKSNSGEGGEDAARFGTIRNSAIKQVASGRFGVTSEYLLSAVDMQIKMAQGAKPGEGGHLPGKKVTPEVAKTRHSIPGVTLISPPPHHDIYSIEDLAQLIFDLKNANRDARVSVKLCSEPGVGTIASGVAKAGAQVVLICGYDGGSGAAPGNSIHFTGLPWELGVAETHQTLMANGLRSKVIVETDGKLMTGRDVAIACMLGAEEFGFATAPLVTLGCCMLRVCNLGTCAAGIATQNPELRKRFTGKPEYVVHFMRFVAQDLREHMARLGVRTINELVGRSDLLKVREKAITERAAKVDLAAILDNPCDGRKRHFDPADVYDFKLEETIDRKVLCKELDLEGGEKKAVTVRVSSTNRTIGTIFGSDITKKYGNTLADDSYCVTCIGGAGQSFGAFIPKGLTLKLEGDANDYLGKGLSGGKIVVYPPSNAKFLPEENMIIGNVALYGATSGEVYISGMAGERFAVRNSGAQAVVEGVGDHGCEYMTGGVVVVLGRTGKNFAAGMSGGVAYVLDENRDLYLRLNKEMVSMDPVSEREDIEQLRELLSRHVEQTGSPRAKRLLTSLSEKAGLFKKILPRDYAKMRKSIESFRAKGLSEDEANTAAFDAVVQ
jgi:glutamate synthase (ferredoxin)